MFSSILTATAFALSVPAAPQDAPDRLFSAHGVELRADENVFLLFSALNVAGYAEESERKGPPLRAPVFHPIRESLRDALRRYRAQPEAKALTALFESNPAELEDYLAAAVGEGGLSPKATKLQKKLRPALAAFGTKVNFVEVFDKLSEAQRDHAKKLLKGVNKDLASATRLLGDKSYRAPTNLVVIPNPLDAHASVRRVTTANGIILVVGPGEKTARRAILEEALRPTVRKLVDKNYSAAKLFSRSWTGLRTSRRIAKRYKNGKNYLTEALTRALAFRIGAGKGGSEADEEFIDEQAKSGMRWARGALRIIDKLGGKPMATNLRRSVGRVSP